MALPLTRAAVRQVVAAVSRALRRPAEDIWTLLQGTAAATVAWVLAKYVFDHPDPFFAPVAALIALNASLGERGLNAIRLLQGVFVGIVVGEATLAVLGGGYGSVALAVFTATALARALNGTRIVLAQAGVGAILTVAIADAEVGLQRLTDALIGAGVALVFSQLLFSPEPLGLLRRAESVVLARMAAALELTAGALGEEDAELAERAIAELRELPADLTELHRLRRASARVARRTLAWRSQRHLVVRENENADQLDLLGASCLTLARVVPSLGPEECRALEPGVRELAATVADLAGELADRTVRQRAADRAFAVGVAVAGSDGVPGSTMAVAVAAVRMLALDVMVFAGVEVDDAVAAVREGILERQVPAPAAPSHGVLGRLRSRLSL